ncbi:MAG: hypothetical protein K0U41_06315 [Gammaproteobacteria bacterium]|nr:hypothetical protein [Gammaproteobacteria bacterium]
MIYEMLENIPRTPDEFDITLEWFPSDTKTAKSLDSVHAIVNTGTFAINPEKGWRRFFFKSYKIRFEPNLAHFGSDEYFREKQLFFKNPIIDTNHIRTIVEAKLIVELLVKSAALYFYVKKTSHLTENMEKFNILLNREKNKT